MTRSRRAYVNVQQKEQYNVVYDKAVSNRVIYLLFEFCLRLCRIRPSPFLIGLENRKSPAPHAPNPSSPLLILRSSLEAEKGDAGTEYHLRIFSDRAENKRQATQYVCRSLTYAVLLSFLRCFRLFN